MKGKGVFSVFVKYVSLNVMGMIAISCYILADTFFVAQGLKENGLAALNLAISVYGFVSGTGLLIGIGGGSRYSFCMAQDDKDGAAKIFTRCIYLSLIAGAFFMFIGLFFSDMLSSLLGANADTHAMTKTYVQTILLFAPFFILNNVLIAFIRNDKSPNLAMTGMIAGSLLNILLDYIFIFPCKMGMFGAAFATGLAPVFSILLLSTHFFKKKNSLRFVRAGISFTSIKIVVSGGISSFITEISSSISLIVFNLIVLRLAGNTGVAAYGIVANFSLVCVAIFVGVAQGIQPLVSASYGAKKDSEVKSLLRYAILSALILAVILYAVIFIFSDGLIWVFNSENNHVLYDYAKKGMIIYFIGFLFAGINIVSGAYLSAISNASKGFLLSIFRGIAFIVPLVIGLSFAFGMTGVWLAFVLAELLTCVFSIVFLRLSRKDIPSRLV